MDLLSIDEFKNSIINECENIFNSEEYKYLYNILESYDVVNEIQQYDDIAYSEYKKIKKFIKGNKIPDELKEQYFELELKYINSLLDKDIKNVNEIIDDVISNLSIINESIDNEKMINILNIYRNDTLNKIESERNQASELYKNNPRILIFK